MRDIKKVAVIGAGTMGHGIAQVTASAGLTVVLNDVENAMIERGIASIGSNLDKGIAKGKVTAEQRETTLSRVRGDADIASAVREADLVIEAVPEKMELKREIFARVDEAAPPTAVLASNTSSLSIGEIGRATTRPGQVVGMHFFNPVHLMPLLEVVKSDATTDEVVECVVAVGRRIGKDPIVVRDLPGFATSRLGVAIGLEAMRMLESGVASAEDIDKAMTLGYRHPMGPLKLTDLVGLDVRLAIAEHLHRELGSDTFRPPEILVRMVREGRLGKKSGRGFYHWE
ncbi:MAG: 3-hydroxyacyl-CoA dehydrogenase family protein [Acidobacteriota bacterium]|nr:3-hydroxyacyl-CoA dehydrogenase family protein [Acidobacteriota bacterium]